MEKWKTWKLNRLVPNSRVEFKSGIQDHFVDEKFIAAIHWSHNDIEIPVSNTNVINEENLEEIHVKYIRKPTLVYSADAHCRKKP